MAWQGDLALGGQVVSVYLMAGEEGVRSEGRKSPAAAGSCGTCAREITLQSLPRECFNRSLCSTHVLCSNPKALFGQNVYSQSSNVFLQRRASASMALRTAEAVWWLKHKDERRSVKPGERCLFLLCSAEKIKALT